MRRLAADLSDADRRKEEFLATLAHELRNPLATVTRQGGHNAVCTQAEWEAKELAAPGANTLLRGAITSDGEAERLARDLQSPPAVPKPLRPSRRAAWAATPPPV